MWLWNYRFDSYSSPCYMNVIIWLLDTYIYICAIILCIFISSWWWSKTPTLRVIPVQKTKKKVRNIYKKFFSKASISLNLSYLYSYFLFLLLTFLIYWYNWILNYTAIQWKLINNHWFYLFNLCVLNLLIWRIYIEWIVILNINSETISVITFLITTFMVYLNITNLFSLVLLLECQGIIFVYFIVQNHNNLKLKKEMQTILESMKQIKIWLTNTIFLQFWASFFGAVVLIFSALQFSSFLGIIHWYDILYFSQLSYTTLCANLNKLTWSIIFLIIGFLLKIGLVPFHVWKPELYKNISYTTMFIYATTYIFSLLVLFINIIIMHSHLLDMYITKFLWYLLVISLYSLLIFLFYISELKVFIAYTSLAHLTYMLAVIITPSTTLYIILFYTCIYILITLAFFITVLTLKSLPLIHLSDLQLLTQVPQLFFQFIIVISSMAGLPPFIGFWGKIATILHLWASNEYILAIYVLSCGMFLMYFYFQTYRFSFVINPKIDVKATQLITSPIFILIGNLIIFACINGYLIVNDILVWSFISLA